MNDDNTSQPKEINSKAEELRTIFSEEEIRSTVKAFVLSYLRGTMKIDFDLAEDIIQDEKKKGTTISYSNAVDKEIKLKKLLIRPIEIVSGSVKSTPEELDETVKELFRRIISLRAGSRIKGVFLEFDIEKRLDQMDERVSATNNVVQEFVNWYIETEKGHDKGVP